MFVVSLVLALKCDCIELFLSGLKYLHLKCNLVHGDISINNLVIARVPPSPPATSSLPASTETRVPDTHIDAYGVVIDYDYARHQDSQTHHTSVRLLPAFSLLLL